MGFQYNFISANFQQHRNEQNLFHIGVFYSFPQLDGYVMEKIHKLYTSAVN